MALSQNKAVRVAYDKGTYTGGDGITWSRGMDGWFDRSNPDLICLIRHHDFVRMVETENPDEL